MFFMLVPFHKRAPYIIIHLERNAERREKAYWCQLYFPSWIIHLFLRFRFRFRVRISFSGSGLVFCIRPLPALRSQTNLIKHVTFVSHGRAANQNFLFYLSSHYHIYFLKSRIIFCFSATIVEMTLLLGMALLWFSVRLMFAVSNNYARVV